MRKSIQRLPCLIMVARKAGEKVFQQGVFNGFDGFLSF